jgi:hypothetical protein
VIGFFVTGFDNWVRNTPDELVGVSINPLHNVVHLAIGTFLIIMCNAWIGRGHRRRGDGVGLFYIVAFVIGVTAPDNLTIISMQGARDLESYNHRQRRVAGDDRTSSHDPSALEGDRLRRRPCGGSLLQSGHTVNGETLRIT